MTPSLLNTLDDAAYYRSLEIARLEEVIGVHRREIAELKAEVDKWEIRAREAAAFEKENARLRASEQAWKIIAKQNDKWNALPQSEKEAALQEALNATTRELELEMNRNAPQIGDADPSHPADLAEISRLKAIIEAVAGHPDLPELLRQYLRGQI